MNHTSVCTDALDYIKEIPKGKFDMIIVDPPAFAKHRGALDNALRAYRRLNANAIEKVRRTWVGKLLGWGLFFRPEVL